MNHTSRGCGPVWSGTKRSLIRGRSRSAIPSGCWSSPSPSVYDDRVVVAHSHEHAAALSHPFRLLSTASSVVLPLSSLSSSSFSTSTSSSDTSSSSSSSSFDLLNRLEQSSRKLLTAASSHHETITSTSSSLLLGEIETELEAWYQALLLIKADDNDRTTNRNTTTTDLGRRRMVLAAAVERMDDLFRVWDHNNQLYNNRNIKNFSSIRTASTPATTSTTTSSTKRPYEIMLYAWSQVVCNGHAALQVLEAWNARYGGDLELAPTRDNAYHAVLLAFANEEGEEDIDKKDNHLHHQTTATTTAVSSSSSMAAVAGHKVRHVDDEAEEVLAAAVAPQVALEVLQKLEGGWGYAYDMAPNLITYQMIVQCLAKGIIMIQPPPRKNDGTNGNSVSLQLLEQQQRRWLEAVVSLVELVLDEVYKNEEEEQYASKSSLIRRRKKRDLAKSEVLAVADSLCNALCCFSVAVSRGGIIFPPQQEKGSLTGGENNNDNFSSSGSSSSSFYTLNRLRKTLGLRSAGTSSSTSSGGGDSVFWSRHQYDWISWQSCLVTLLSDPQHRRVFLSLLPTSTTTSSSSSSKTSSNSTNTTIVSRLNAATTAAQRLALRSPHLPQEERGRLAEALLEPLSNLFPVGVCCLPSLEHYHLTVKAWSGANDNNNNDNNSGRRHHHEAHRERQHFWLSRMEEAHQQQLLQALQQNNHHLDDVAHAGDLWNRLMMAHFEARNLTRVHEIWKEMSSSPLVRRNSLSFSVILKALAAEVDIQSNNNGNSSSNNPIRAATQAHAILKRMVAKPRSERYIQPNAQHFGSVMVAWSKSRHKQAGKYCSEIFDILRREAEQDPSLKPTVVHYSALIASWGWQRGQQKQSEAEEDPIAAVRKILELFVEMRERNIEPDLASCVTVLIALSHTHTTEGAIRAQELLEQMEQEAHSSSSSLGRGDRGRRLVAPDRQCYVSAMHAWASAPPSALAPERCEALLNRHEQAYRLACSSSNNTSSAERLRPNSFAYRALLEAWTRFYGSCEPQKIGVKAEEVLDRMEAAAVNGMSSLPDSKMYASVMSAYLKSSRGSSSNSRRSSSRSRNFNGSASVTDVDDALFVVERMERVLERMKKSYESGNVAAKPDAKAMTLLIRAYAKTRLSNKALIAWNILQQMCEAYQQGDVNMRPTAHAFGAVLDACASTESTSSREDKEEAVKIALKAMNELDEGTYDRPNSHTFRSLFVVVGRQMMGGGGQYHYHHDYDPKEAERIATVIFHRCCQEGVVNSFVLKAIQDHVPALYAKLPVDPQNKNKLRLPANWTRHAV